MKAVMISIQPKWCELIISEQKTIEVRKTEPKINTPFKCYIYQTAEKVTEIVKEYDSNFKLLRRKKTLKEFSGKVIGEFACDKIEDFSQWEYDYASLLRHIDLYAGTNGEYNFLNNYLKGKKQGYGWHISNLKIYDNPKELKEFKKYGFLTEEEWLFGLYPNTHCHYEAWEKKFEITRPPQSWCYVKELEEDK